MNATTPTIIARRVRGSIFARGLMAGAATADPVASYDDHGRRVLVSVIRGEVIETPARQVFRR